MTATAEPRTAEIPTADELIARAEFLVPVFKQRARQAEELRRIPDENIADLEEAGLFYIVSPRSEGGYGYGLRELAQVTRILAHGCTSTAWVYNFLVVHNIAITQDVPSLLDGKPFAKAALSAGFQAMPSGTARRVDGGWRVTGTWPFASGIMNADYALLITTVEQDPSSDADPEFVGLVCEVKDAEIEDVWYFAGMAATGSNTFSLDDVFIPEERQWTVYGFPRLRPQLDPDDIRPLEGFSIIRMFDVLLVACAIGAMEEALSDFKARILKRTVGFGLGPQREHPEAWGRYGRAVTEARLARTFWEETLRIVADYADRKEQVPVETAAWLRMASVRTCQVARDAVQIITEGSGSSIYHLDNPLQRQQRDINTLKNHSYLHPDGSYVPAGKALLGLADPVDALLLA